MTHEPPPPPADRTPAEVLAAVAWQHLLNRHDLAQALTQLDTPTSDHEQVLAAVEHLTVHPPALAGPLSPGAAQ